MFRKYCFAISGICGYVTLLSALDFDDIGHMHTFSFTYKPFHNILSEVILFPLISISYVKRVMFSLSTRKTHLQSAYNVI